MTSFASGGRQRVVAQLERLARLLQNDAHGEGLRPAQWDALRFLARANRFSRSPSAVTAYLGVTKGTVSQTLIALERKGLIVKKEVPTDRRVTILEVSAQGRRVLRQDPLSQVAAVVEELGADQVESLTDGLQAILGQLLRARQGRPFGACKDCRHFKPSADRRAPYWCSLLEEPLTQEDSAKICVEQEAAA